GENILPMVFSSRKIRPDYNPYLTFRKEPRNSAHNILIRFLIVMTGIILVNHPHLNIKKFQLFPYAPVISADLTAQPDKLVHRLIPYELRIALTGKYTFSDRDKPAECLLKPLVRPSAQPALQTVA